MQSKYRLNISDENLTSELRCAVSRFQRPVLKKYEKYHNFILITCWDDNILAILG